MTSHFFSSQFFALCGGTSASFFSLCPVRSSSFSFLLNFSLSAGAPQLLFLLHAPFDSLLSFFFSIFHSLRGISASFPSPCPVRSSSFSFLLNFSLSAGHLSFFFLSMPRPMHWFSDYKAAMPAGSGHIRSAS